MKKPLLSIVIPHHNAAADTVRLLSSLAQSKHAPAFEVIIVDDGSENSIKYQVSLRPRSGRESINYSKLFALRIVRLELNRGPAVARNRGAKAARGKFLVFMDSDVEAFADTLANIAAIFRDDSDIVALTGVWVKEQKSHAFFPNFKALRDWSYWINERDKSGYYFLFSTRIASIKKSVFLRLGGFDETYPAPLVEDIELTYRIARRYAIIFAPSVRVRHEFEGFWPIAKKYFLRAYYWTKLYERRKKFDPVATTWQEAATTVSGVGTVFGLLFELWFFPWRFLLNHELRIMNHVIAAGAVPIILDSFFIILFFLHMLLIRKFFLFLYEEKGLWFAIRGFFMGLVLYCFIFAGAAWGKIRT